MKTARLISLFLAVLIVLAVLVSCSNKGESEETTAAGVGETTYAPETEGIYDENGFIKDSIPVDLKYNGETIVILCDNGQQKQVHVAEQNGDIVNDAVWSREQTVKDRLGVNIEMRYDDINWNNRTVFLDKVGAYISSGVSDFDLVVGYNLAIPMLSARGYCLNLADTEYLKLDQPWWPSEYVNNLTYKGKIYCVCESGGKGVIRNMSAVFFNKTMLETFSSDNIYDIVLNGSWTFEKLSQLMTGCYRDLNGNGQKDAADQFGFSTAYNPLFDAYFYAMGNKLTVYDSEGNPSFTLSDIDHVTAYLEKICDFLYKTDDVMSYDPSQYAMFKQERAVFYGSPIAITDQLKDTGVIYGVAPMPKADESQDRYYTHVANTYDVWCILTTCKNADKSSAVLECYASEAYRQVNPAYFETALKYKYASDNQTAQVYDIIRESVVIDFAYAYSCAFSKMPMLYIRECVTSDNRNWASNWASISKVLDTTLKKITDDINSYGY